ncbi:hypothetical protein oki361_24890 [Helicobacter pylori]
MVLYSSLGVILSGSFLSRIISILTSDFSSFAGSGFAGSGFAGSGFAGSTGFVVVHLAAMVKGINGVIVNNHVKFIFFICFLFLFYLFRIKNILCINYIIFWRLIIMILKLIKNITSN